MSAMTRWNPFKEMDELQRRLATVFDLAPYRRGELANGASNENISVPEWSPAVDIIEDENEYLIKAELPEVAKNDVKVTVENGTLTISGERRSEKDEKNKKFHRVERFYGRFVRSFTLPDHVDDQSVKAEFKDGVLRVHLAKSEKAVPKQIEVKVS